MCVKETFPSLSKTFDGLPVQTPAIGTEWSGRLLAPQAGSSAGFSCLVLRLIDRMY